MVWLQRYTPSQVDHHERSAKPRWVGAAFPQGGEIVVTQHQDTETRSHGFPTTLQVLGCSRR